MHCISPKALAAPRSASHLQEVTVVEVATLQIPAHCTKLETGSHLYDPAGWSRSLIRMRSRWTRRASLLYCHRLCAGRPTAGCHHLWSSPWKGPPSSATMVWSGGPPAGVSSPQIRVRRSSPPLRALQWYGPDDLWRGDITSKPPRGRVPSTHPSTTWYGPS